MIVTIGWFFCVIARTHHRLLPRRLFHRPGIHHQNIIASFFIMTVTNTISISIMLSVLLSIAKSKSVIVAMIGTIISLRIFTSWSSTVCSVSDPRHGLRPPDFCTQHPQLFFCPRRRNCSQAIARLTRLVPAGLRQKAQDTETEIQEALLGETSSLKIPGDFTIKPKMLPRSARSFLGAFSCVGIWNDTQDLAKVDQGDAEYKLKNLLGGSCCLERFRNKVKNQDNIRSKRLLTFDGNCQIIVLFAYLSSWRPRIWIWSKNVSCIGLGKIFLMKFGPFFWSRLKIVQKKSYLNLFCKNGSFSLPCQHLGLHRKIFWRCLSYIPSLQIPRGERCRRDRVKAWPRQAFLAKKFSPRNCQMKLKVR